VDEAKRSKIWRKYVEGSDNTVLDDEIFPVVWNRSGVGGARDGIFSFGGAVAATVEAEEKDQAATGAAEATEALAGIAVEDKRGDGRKIALVTGANKGIGKEIARQLGSLPDVTTILACRNEKLAAAAVAELKAAGCAEVVHCCLDLVDPVSIASARDFVEREYGRLDILINNAAVCFNDPTLYGKVRHTSFQQQADITIRTNFFGTLLVIQSMLPLMQTSSSPRIVNIASNAGRLAIMKSQQKVQAFMAPALRVEELEELMHAFVRDVQAGVHSERGWPNTCYGTSKCGLIALGRVLARDEPRFMVNSISLIRLSYTLSYTLSYLSYTGEQHRPRILCDGPEPEPGPCSRGTRGAHSRRNRHSARLAVYQWEVLL
jgi:carbonyl reductase 1